MTYIPDLTERYPEPDPTNETPEVGEVWENMITFTRIRVYEVHDHYIITDTYSKIDLDDLKNNWVLIG